MHFYIWNRDRLIETNGKGTRVKVEVAQSQAHLPVILHPYGFFINSCRHVDQLQLSVRIVSVRGKSHLNPRMKWMAMATRLFVLDRTSVSAKWINNSDVLVDVEPVLPNRHLTCCTSKHPSARWTLTSFFPASKQDGSTHPICLVGACYWNKPLRS